MTCVHISFTVVMAADPFHMNIMYGGHLEMTARVGLEVSTNITDIMSSPYDSICFQGSDSLIVRLFRQW